MTKSVLDVIWTLNNLKKNDLHRNVAAHILKQCLGSQKLPKINQDIVPLMFKVAEFCNEMARQNKTNPNLRRNSQEVFISSNFGQKSIKNPADLAGSYDSLLKQIFKTQHRNFSTMKTFTNTKKNKQLYVNFNTKCNLQGKSFSKQVTTQKERTIPKEELEENWGGPEAYKLITFLKEDFDDVVNKLPSVLVFFSASWCQHCLRLRKTYGKAALMAKEANLPMAFATFDVDSYPDIADAKGVVGIPNLKYFKNGKFITNFKGKRTVEDLMEFAKNPPTAPVKEVKKPDI